MYMRLSAGGMHMIVTPPMSISPQSTNSPNRSSLDTSYGIKEPPVMAAQPENQASMNGMPLCRWINRPPSSGLTRKWKRCTRK